MIRLLLYIFGKKDFEECKSCETLKQQLAIANAEKAEAIATIINLAKPRVVQATELKSVIPSSGTWARRARALEERDKAEAKARVSDFAASRPEIVKVSPERVSELEQELGISNG